METRRVWLSYTLIRVALFAVPFAVLMVSGVLWLWSALIATVFSFCASYIFLRRQRETMSSDLAAIRQGRKSPTVDDDVEDAAVERRDLEH
jgi:hypothetical protein